MRSRVITSLLLVLLGASSGSGQPVRRDYFAGDWTSWVPLRYVTALAQSFDILYIATPYGVGRYQTVTRRFLPPLTASSGLDNPRILRIAFDEQWQTLWVVTPGGTASFNEVLDEWQFGGTFPERAAADDVAEIRFNNLFTPWELSYHLPDRASPHGMFVDHHLRRFPITTALRSRMGGDRVFIGTWGLGTGEIDEVSLDVQFPPSGPYQSTVQALYRLHDTWLFAGRDESGEPPVISLFDTRDGSWRYEQPFYSIAARGDITCIEAVGGDVFFGTPQGLLKWTPDDGKWRTYSGFDGLPDDWVTSLQADGELLWVGTRKGPGLLDARADTGRAAISLATGAIGQSWVYAFEKAYGFVWAGTETGAYRISQSQGDWARVATREGLLRGHVRALALRPEGLWCATDGGLLRIDSELRPQEVFRSRVELSDGDIYTLAVDADNIWAGSRSGVWRYLRGKRTWRNYTRQDGLLADFVYTMEIDGDYIWFGTEGGVTRFHWNNPDRID